MRKKVFTLNGKKYYSEEEYLKEREQFINYRSEQELAVAKFGFASGYAILAGSQSEIVTFPSAYLSL